MRVKLIFITNRFMNLLEMLGIVIALFHSLNHRKFLRHDFTILVRKMWPYDVESDPLFLFWAHHHVMLSVKSAIVPQLLLLF